MLDDVCEDACERAVVLWAVFVLMEPLLKVAKLFDSSIDECEPLWAGEPDDGV